MELTKPSITRLARVSGIKSIADNCYFHIRELATNRIETILDQVLAFTDKKTLLAEDLYTILELRGEGLTQSDSIGEGVMPK